MSDDQLPAVSLEQALLGFTKPYGSPLWWTADLTVFATVHTVTIVLMYTGVVMMADAFDPLLGLAFFAGSAAPAALIGALTGRITGGLVQRAHRRGARPTAVLLTLPLYPLIGAGAFTIPALMMGLDPAAHRG